MPFQFACNENVAKNIKGSIVKKEKNNRNIPKNPLKFLNFEARTILACHNILGNPIVTMPERILIIKWNPFEPKILVNMKTLMKIAKEDPTSKEYVRLDSWEIYINRPDEMNEMSMAE